MYHGLGLIKFVRNFPVRFSVRELGRETFSPKLPHRKTNWKISRKFDHEKLKNVPGNLLQYLIYYISVVASSWRY